jgi:Domain of unknown function (DUF4129)
MRAAFLLVLVLLGCASGVRAQEDSISAPQEVVDVRRFDPASIAAYKADPELQYDQDLRREPSLWERIKAWLYDWLDSIFGSRVGNWVVNNLIYIAAVVLIVFALYILSRHRLRNAFYGAPRSLGEVTAAEEDIRGLDIEAMIREAEAQGDLRRAIRLHYLLVLRRLVDQGVLKWSPEKTDRDYMAQIKDPALRSRFAHLALVFQWVWYGHAEVDRARYDSIRLPFVEFETAPAR